ncbi:helix-turn-helix transcriptional regulator [Kitasatospora sp. NPDC093806]|uniref:response regulator transcription factor n=1 Tax=Kitasatospora sp. NPDC093806 TaxID=3155075 RepID=UPI00344257BA
MSGAIAATFPFDAESMTIRHLEAVMEFHLSHRQREIVLLISEGNSNKEIGRILDVSPRTVESHLQRLYLRYGINSRAALVAKWLRADPAASAAMSEAC